MARRCGGKIWTGVVTVACSLGVLGLAGCTAALAGDGHGLLSAAADKPFAASSISERAASASSVADSAASAETGTWRDGTYYANGQGGKFGDVPVTVVIRDGKIETVSLGANSETEAMAEKARAVVVPQILRTQGTDDIDVATGATMTSDAIVDGVRRALERAGQ